MISHVVAVIGASGFIGNRFVEMLHLGGEHRVRPIVRRASGLALASRFAIQSREADALDVPALERALLGCDIAVHAIAGDPDTIVRSAASVYEAAARAGCCRLIYLSSAMVHGQAPLANCHEATPLPRNQGLRYNKAKVAAEDRLRGLRSNGELELVILRPGIVYGPRSQWIGGLADQLLASEAYLVDGGAGLCNAIYVDNVVDAAIRCFDAPQADNEAFLLGEADPLSWREFYARVAGLLGTDITAVPRVDFDRRAPGLKDRIDQLRQSQPVRIALGALPPPLSRGFAAFWEASGALPARSGAIGPQPTLETALLHRAQYVPSWSKARTVLGYEPTVLSDEAWGRTLNWLAFAGYPVARRL